MRFIDLRLSKTLQSACFCGLFNGSYGCLLFRSSAQQNSLHVSCARKGSTLGRWRIREWCQRHGRLGMAHTGASALLGCIQDVADAHHANMQRRHHVPDPLVDDFWTINAIISSTPSTASKEACRVLSPCSPWRLNNTELLPSSAARSNGAALERCFSDFGAKGSMISPPPSVMSGDSLRIMMRSPAHSTAGLSNRSWINCSVESVRSSMTTALASNSRLLLSKRMR